MSVLVVSRVFPSGTKKAPVPFRAQIPSWYKYVKCLAYNYISEPDVRGAHRIYGVFRLLSAGLLLQTVIYCTTHLYKSQMEECQNHGKNDRIMEIVLALKKKQRRKI